MSSQFPLRLQLPTHSPLALLATFPSTLRCRNLYPQPLSLAFPSSVTAALILSVRLFPALSSVPALRYLVRYSGRIGTAS